MNTSGAASSLALAPAVPVEAPTPSAAPQVARGAITGPEDSIQGVTKMGFSTSEMNAINQGIRDRQAQPFQLVMKSQQTNSSGQVIPQIDSSNVQPSTVGKVQQASQTVVPGQSEQFTQLMNLKKSATEATDASTQSTLAGELAGLYGANLSRLKGEAMTQAEESMGVANLRAQLNSAERLDNIDRQKMGEMGKGIPQGDSAETAGIRRTLLQAQQGAIMMQQKFLDTSSEYQRLQSEIAPAMDSLAKKSDAAMKRQEVATENASPAAIKAVQELNEGMPEGEAATKVKGYFTSKNPNFLSVVAMNDNLAEAGSIAVKSNDSQVISIAAKKDAEARGGSNPELVAQYKAENIARLREAQTMRNDPTKRDEMLLKANSIRNTEVEASTVVATKLKNLHDAVMAGGSKAAQIEKDFYDNEIDGYLTYQNTMKAGSNVANWDKGSYGVLNSNPTIKDILAISNGRISLTDLTAKINSIEDIGERQAAMTALETSVGSMANKFNDGMIGRIDSTVLMNSVNQARVKKYTGFGSGDLNWN